jgi:hypothetical protein
MRDFEVTFRVGDVYVVVPVNLDDDFFIDLAKDVLEQAGIVLPYIEAKVS